MHIALAPLVRPAVAAALSATLLDPATAFATEADADMIMLTPAPGDLPIQFDTPLGPVAGTPTQIGLLGLGVLSAIATILRGVSDGLSGLTSSSVYRTEQQKQQPFGRSVQDTISRVKALTDQPADEDATEDGNKER